MGIDRESNRAEYLQTLYSKVVLDAEIPYADSADVQAFKQGFNADLGNGMTLIKVAGIFSWPYLLSNHASMSSHLGIHHRTSFSR